MSRETKHIEISAPKYLYKYKTIMFSELVENEELLDAPTIATEHIASVGHKCTRCHGNGYFWQKKDKDVVYKERCSVCGGTGKIDALITIEWKSQNK